MGFCELSKRSIKGFYTNKDVEKKLVEADKSACNDSVL